MVSNTQYNFFEDAYNQLQSSKPVANVESEEIIKKRAKLNAIAEGLRTIAELTGNSLWNAPVEKREPNKEVLKSLQDYNNLKAKEGADMNEWNKMMYGFKLSNAARKEQQQAKKDELEAADKRNREKIKADQAEGDKNRQNAVKIANIRTNGKEDENDLDKEIQFNYFEGNQPKQGKAKKRELKSVGSRILNQFTYEELRKKYPGVADKIDKIQYDAKKISDDDLITLGQTFWSDFKEGFYPSGETTTEKTENINWFNPQQQKENIQIPFRPNAQNTQSNDNGMSDEQINLLREANKGITEEDIKNLSKENDQLLGSAMEDLVNGVITKEQYLEVRKLLIGK